MVNLLLEKWVKKGEIITWSPWTSDSGQCCCPSCIQKLQSSVIWDFLEMEDQMGTWEVMWAFREELEMH